MYNKTTIITIVTLGLKKIKQLNKQIVIAVLNIQQALQHVMPHCVTTPSFCMAISLAVTSCTEADLAKQDQHNKINTLDKIVASY